MNVDLKNITVWIVIVEGNVEDVKEDYVLDIVQRKSSNVICGINCGGICVALWPFVVCGIFVSFCKFLWFVEVFTAFCIWNMWICVDLCGFLWFVWIFAVFWQDFCRFVWICVIFVDFCNFCTLLHTFAHFCTSHKNPHKSTKILSKNSKNLHKSQKSTKTAQNHKNHLKTYISWDLEKLSKNLMCAFVRFRSDNTKNVFLRCDSYYKTVLMLGKSKYFILKAIAAMGVTVFIPS